MSDVDKDMPEERDDDLLAAEFVLGVLPQTEHIVAAHRAETEPEFQRLVIDWTERFAPLSDGYAAVTPPASVKQSLDRRLFGTAAQQTAGFWSRAAFWRLCAGVATAAFVLAVTLPFMMPEEPTAPRRTASLSAEGSDVHYVALVDLADGTIGLSHMTGVLEPGQDFELWVIVAPAAPVSLGVIPAGASVRLPLTVATGAMLGADAVFAISLEPEGGSPTGQPTGPVVAAGDLRDI